jgi:hypothetical protein
MGLDETITIAEAHMDGTPEDVDIQSQDDLVNGYVLFSELESDADDRRKSVRDELQDRMQEDGQNKIEGDFGNVTLIEATKRSLIDEDDVFDRMLEAGVKPQEIMSVDQDLVEEAAEENGVDIDDVTYEYSYEYLRKSGVDRDRMRDIIQTCESQADGPGEINSCLTEFAADD